jgi:two-component system, OmpR family, alkaline phosphatase synthesis response regulator PhoP
MDKKKILVVDDEKEMVFAIKMALETHGFDVLDAYDGQTALDIAREKAPDLIILDIMLPKIDGYKVCRMLKFDKKYKKTPIILFTARLQQNDEKTGYEVGADAYMTKPFEAQNLLKKIKELLKIEA